jgi:hypothetical protein
LTDTARIRDECFSAQVWSEVGCERKREKDLKAPTPAIRSHAQEAQLREGSAAHFRQQHDGLRAATLPKFKA